LFDWNRTQADFPNTNCIHELFEEQAARTPDADAVVFGAERLSYRELNERANQWAHHLRSLGAGPEKLVGIAFERSPEMIAGVLAILKSGAAYVPLSPDTPPERLEMMVQDAGIELLLTQLERGQFDLLSRQNPELKSRADNLAYVIYTSG
jgi:non-ribosomal peptide synthetase component F